MLNETLKRLEGALHIDPVSAHCDIPCKIYDPAVAQIAALSVVRLMDIMAEAAGKPAGLDQANTISRCVMRKEEEAEHVKQEIRVIWGDYLKQPQFERFPNAHELVHRIMLKASACKQGVDRADGVALVDLVNEFADLFWATKGVATERKVCPYPPALEVVRPVL